MAIENSEDPSKKPLLFNDKHNSIVKINLLDGSVLDLYINRKSNCEELLKKVCESLHVMERGYFGLTYISKKGSKKWLKLHKQIEKCVTGKRNTFNFEVKFYHPNPDQIEDDTTRHQFLQQIRQDVLSGKMQCSVATQALLGSYFAQYELGDYNSNSMGANYLSKLKYATEQSEQTAEKVVALHKSHKGLTKREAELFYLENAKKLELYGIELHPAKDSEGVDIMLGARASGIFVYKNGLKINKFAWPKLRKIGFRTRKFYVTIRPSQFDEVESTVSFQFANYKVARDFWKTCKDCHMFFRKPSLTEPKSEMSLVPRLWSKFRYSLRGNYKKQISTDSSPSTDEEKYSK